MGSLFDGVGGFPLAAVRNGIEPLWASEIEAFPIEVTKTHFPNMLHVGDITKLDGAKLPPVDIICGGSPCQDLSVAGARAGLAGERSGLFMEQIRVIVRPVDIAVIELLDRLRAPAGGPGGQRRGVSGAVGSLSERALPPEPDPNRVTRGISAARRRKRRQGNPDRTLLTSCGLPHTGTYAAARSLLREGAQATTTPLALLSLRGDAAVTAVELPDNVEAQRAGNARHGEACQMVRGRHTRRGSGAGYGRRLLRTDSAPGHAPAPACCAPARERVCWTFVGQRALTWR